MTTRRAVMWFRRDLRLSDHPALLAAAQVGEVVPLFVIDPVFDRTGAPRRAFLHDCLLRLDASLRDLGAPGLLVRAGRPEEVVPSVCAEFSADVVVVSRDFAPGGRARDAAVAAALRTAGRELRGTGSPYAVTPGSVTKGNGEPYAVFTPFSRAWRSAGWDLPFDPPEAARWATLDEPLGQLGQRPHPGCDVPAAGEEAALTRWARFLGARLDDYSDGRDRPDVEGTSRMSVDLKWGTVHPRTLLADLVADGTGPDSHTRFSAELAWREFYADVLFRNPITAWENLNPKMNALEVDTDSEARTRFRSWCAGETGFGFVDAGMRELAATGWMHNRARMITASFLVKDLHLPWQWGARWFLRHLVDGDLASNNHGWQWVAGTGTDAAPFFRVFSPERQRERFDPDGAYVDRWVGATVAPMVDHAAERVEALRRFEATKRSQRIDGRPQSGGDRSVR